MNVHPVSSPSDAVRFVADLFAALPPVRDWPEQTEPVAWRESHMPAESFPEHLTSEEHRTFSITRLETIWPSPVESSRVRRLTGGEVQTILEVRWAFGLLADDAAESYRASLAAESELVDSIVGYHDLRVSPIRLTLVSARTITGSIAASDGTDLVSWVIGTIQVRADHVYGAPR